MYVYFKIPNMIRHGAAEFTKTCWVLYLLKKNSKKTVGNTGRGARCALMTLDILLNYQRKLQKKN